MEIYKDLAPTALLRAMKRKAPVIVPEYN